LAGVLLVLGAAAVVVRPLTAQLPDAEAAFKRGDYRAARAAYERALAADSTNVRALYQLAILDSWDGKLGRSLERFGRLRRLASQDGDIMVAQARVLAWADRTVAAGALYDSVLARAPDRTDALAGRRCGARCGPVGGALRSIPSRPARASALGGRSPRPWAPRPRCRRASAYGDSTRTVAPGPRP